MFNWLVMKKCIKVHTLFIALTFIVCTPLMAQWEKVLDKDSILVYNKPNSNGYSYYKAQGYIEASLDDIVVFFSDIERFPEWVDNCSDAKILHKEENEFVYYVSYDMPWPLTDRYAVSQLKISRPEEGRCEFNSQPNLSEMPDVADALRVTRFKERVVLVSKSDKLTVIYMSGAYDPGGDIPLWVTDKFIKYGPYDMILNMKKSLE